MIMLLMRQYNLPFSNYLIAALIINKNGAEAPCYRKGDIMFYELTDRIILHSEKCKCGRHTHWLEIEGRTDDTLVFENGVKTAPMSLYKILEEVKAIRRFQLVQTAPDRLELRMVSDAPEAAFAEAKRELQIFFESKGIQEVELNKSDQAPQADPVSGKFKHIYKGCERSAD